MRYVACSTVVRVVRIDKVVENQCFVVIEIAESLQTFDTCTCHIHNNGTEARRNAKVFNGNLTSILQAKGLIILILMTRNQASNRNLFRANNTIYQTNVYFIEKIVEYYLLLYNIIIVYSIGKKQKSKKQKKPNIKPIIIFAIFIEKFMKRPNCKRPFRHGRAPANFQAYNRFSGRQKVVCKQHRTAAKVISTIMANITLVVGDTLYLNRVSLRMSLKEARNRTLCTSNQQWAISTPHKNM